MKQYKLIELDCAGEHLRIRSTDPETIQWILEEIKSIAPQYKVDTANTPLGHLYFANIYKIGTDVNSFGWMLLTKLSAKGWEPFKSETRSHPWLEIFHLRFEIAEN